MSMVSWSFRVLLLFLLAHHHGFAQIGSTILPSRRVNWQKSGYEGVFPTKFDDSITVNVGESVESAIRKASTKKGLTLVHLMPGIHYLDTSLVLHRNVVLKGEDMDETIVAYVGDVNKAGDIIIVAGMYSSKEVAIVAYDSLSNSVRLQSGYPEIRSGDYVEAFVDPQGKSCVGRECVGQTVKVLSRSEQELTLEDDFRLAWSLKESHTLSVRLIYPAQQVGIEALTIRPLIAGSSNGNGTNIKFYCAVNCWVRNVKSLRPVETHIGIGRSSRVEVRECTFQYAEGYGAGGRGYGVSIANRSTNCLVENNIFEHLRHAMVVSMGANRNVFGYNYSREQYDSANYQLGDINVHGHYPFANLFEGNYVVRIHADVYHSDNGPYNTFLRNYSSDHIARFEVDDLQPSTSAYNILGNEAEVYFVRKLGPFCSRIIEPDEALSAYGIQSANDSSVTDGFPKRSRHEWRSDLEGEAYLSDISYLYDARPSFFDAESTWPPIGPPIMPYGELTKQTIPARKRWQTSSLRQ